MSGQRVRIRGNRIYENRSASGPGLGIELGSFGIQVNDPGDGDSGANGFQNYPILLSAGPAFAEGGSNHIVGVLNSTPSTQFTIDFYANPPCAARPQEFLEGEIPLGSTFVTTDGSGNATIDISIGPPQPPGSRYSATATDPDGNTSEFSQRIVFSLNNPTSGPAAGRHGHHDQGHALRGRGDRDHRRRRGDERRRRQLDHDHGHVAGRSRPEPSIP